jgi:hypothetical protein
VWDRVQDVRNRHRCCQVASIDSSNHTTPFLSPTLAFTIYNRIPIALNNYTTLVCSAYTFALYTRGTDSYAKLHHRRVLF